MAESSATSAGKEEHTSALASAVKTQGILFVALNLLLATSASRVRHVEVLNKAKAVLAGADPNFKVASLRRYMLMSSICPEDGRDGKTSSRHVDDTAVSAAPLERSWSCHPQGA